MLNRRMSPNFAALCPQPSGGGGGGTLSYTQTDTAVEFLGSSGGKVRTYTAKSIGTASSDRIVVVQLGLVAGVNTTAVAVTVGGVSLTSQILLDPSVNNGMALSLFSGLITTGTSADVVVTLTDAVANNPIVSSAVNVGIITGSATASVSGTASKARSYSGVGVCTASSALTIPTGGIVIAVADQNTGGSGTSTWGTGMAGLSHLNDASLYSGTFGKSTGTGSVTPSVTFSVDGNNAMVAAVWGP